MSTEEKIRQLPPLPDRESFFASLRRSFDEAGLGELLTQEAEERFYILLGYMLDEGSRLNVTAICSLDEIIAKHFTDSAAVAPYLPQGCSVCDVGTGGGFPALPLAIVRPDLRITALDSTAKKIAYVAEGADRLGLDGFRAVSGRAEELGGEGGKLREGFDTVVSRAVASLPVLCELCLPLVRVGGSFIAMKGPSGREELAASGSAIEKLGGAFSAEHETIIRLGEEHLCHPLFVIEKCGHTPTQYPRQFSKIAKRPL